MSLPEPGAAERFAEGLTPGIHRAPSSVTLVSLQAALDSIGYDVFVVDLDEAGDKSGILDAMAIGLDFPDWVGRNWDALDDAMRDLGWLPTGDRGRGLILRGLEPAEARPTADFAALEDVLQSAVVRWAETSTPLVVVAVD